ncbi:MAG: DUF2884 family protein [Kangiellaceae bacterium]|jgi:hypothetical protein
MKKILIGSLATILCLPLAAHNNEVCEYGLDYNININSNSVKFSNDKTSTIEFSDSTITVDGKTLKLNSEQRGYSHQFEKGTRQVVPKIADIAIEGAEIGLKAATLAVTALFGEDQEVHKDLILPIEKISEKIKANVNDKMINAHTIETSFDQELEQEIEGLVAKALSKYSGKILGQVLSSVFSGDGEEMKDFEFRMENLEHDIETYVDSQAVALEEKAETICEDIKILSELDQKLMAVDGYPSKGLISLGNDHSKKLSSIKFDFNH